jgi:predicted Zn-dependent protease
VGIVFSRELISKKVVQVIPFEIEQMIGDRLIGSVLPTHSRIYDEEILKLLGQTLEPLRLALPSEYREFKFYVSADPQVNAFAIPGGHIVFNMGALKVANDASELLGVAAHELAHVTQRHSMRNIIQGAGIFVLLQAFFGDVTGIIAVIADQGSFLMNQSFSRSMETDADKKGFQYLLEAKIDPRGMSRFFQHVLKQPNFLGDAGKKAEKTLEFLSTHPNTEDRIKQIEFEYLALSEATKSAFKSDLESFKALKQKLSEKK